MRKAITVLTAVAILVTTSAGAVEFSHDTGEDLKESKERSMSQKNSDESKDSSTKKKGKSKSDGRDRTSSRSSKGTGTLGENEALDLSLPAQAVFTLPDFRYLLPSDFGWTGQEGGGVINSTRAEYYRQRAGSNAPLDPEEQEKVKAYLNQIAEAGAQVGQAMLYLQQDIGNIGKLSRDGKGNIMVKGLGADDLQVLAAGALRRSGRILTDKRISSRLTTILKDSTPCRFYGDPGRLQCGHALLELASPPVLRVDGVEWFGNSSFAGLSGTYKVSSAWSFSRVLEDAKGDSKFTKYATEVAESAEHLEAEGKSFEAVLARKKAIERMRANKAGVGPGKFMPSIH